MSNEVKMTDNFKKHRVIGIRYTLRSLKDAGLIEEDSSYPDEALSDLHDEILSVARTWYKVGAKRGATEIFNEFLSGNLEVKIKPDGSREIIANTGKLSWERVLNVSVGNSKKKIKSKTYKLSYTDDLGFK
jgi:hypothetical protein